MWDRKLNVSAEISGATKKKKKVFKGNAPLATKLLFSFFLFFFLFTNYEKKRQHWMPRPLKRCHVPAKSQVALLE